MPVINQLGLFDVWLGSVRAVCYYIQVVDEIEPVFNALARATVFEEEVESFDAALVRGGQYTGTACSFVGLQCGPVGLPHPGGA